MPDFTPDSPLTALKGVGPARAAALAASGWHHVADLLKHLPFRYEDRRRRVRVAEVSTAGRYGVRGRIRDLKLVRIRRRGLTLVRGWIDDDSGRLAALWFNRPYLTRQVDPETEYFLYGEVRSRGGHLELVNPSLEPVDGEGGPSGIVPFYPAIAGLSGALLRSLIRQALDRCDSVHLTDDLPTALLQRRGLPRLGEALRRLHLPAGADDLESLNGRATSAHWRLSYGEFLELQTELGFLRRQETQRPKPHRHVIDNRVRRAMRDVLPFRLTGAQRRVLQEIGHDLLSPHPMLRLLQGDVGSGKTIVAILSLVIALESGLQGALMVPTELLAEQHFRQLARLLGGRYEMALLTSSTERPQRIRERLANGEIQLVIGTHALIQEGTEFNRLGLAVIDEQHRFGVAQRRLLQRKGNQPDLLVMTATPIPRSLALTVYGDLALSVIDELPPGRQPVVTRIVPKQQRAVVYRWVRRKIAAGLQAYVVFPLIEESEQLQAQSIASMGEQVRRYLAAFDSAILHGRTRADEREEIMRRFASGELRILVATTVIEVGVDVPNAAIMVIESGERFGLSQLHQLRGRVGRGSGPSWCVVIHGSLTDLARQRLKVLGETADGFRIAEADLEIRGPGDLLGTRQSGLPFFHTADIIRDRIWLERAREDAMDLISQASGDADGFADRMRERANERYGRIAGG